MLKGNKYLFSRIVFLTVLMFVLAAAPAGAATYGFYSITNTIEDDAYIGESQLFVDVTNPGGNQVLFTFRNEGPEASSICDVYFDNGIFSSLLGIAEIDNSSSGVMFSQDASPGNLPGANNVAPPFVTMQGFSLDSDPSVSHNGVNPGEWLGILFNLQDGNYFDNVLTELGNRKLRIGLHVQAFDSGGSESFINNNNPVPIPASVLLLGSGLIGLVGFRRKKIAK